MSLEEETLAMHHAAAVANAVLAARAGHPLQSAKGLVLFASVLVEGDDEACTELAAVMHALAIELAPKRAVAMYLMRKLPERRRMRYMN